MQAVGSVFGSMGAASAGAPGVGDAGVDWSSPSGFGAAAGGGFGTAGVLSAARFGTSALSALSGFAMSQEQATTMNIEAGDEELAARADYVQAQQKNNAINLQFNKVIGSQLAVASAGNIDVGSGSVQEAGRQAEQQRNREQQAAWQSAQTDATLRTMRANLLTQNASTTSTVGYLSEASRLATAGLQLTSAGGD